MPARMRSVDGMDITINASFLPHTDAEASLTFYRDVLGFEVRKDVGYQQMRWITVGPVGQPDTAIVLTPPAVDPGINDAERSTILELMAKGSYGGIVLSTDDVDGAFAAIEAMGADVVQEPIDQPYGIRDCAFRDPAGNMVRLQQAA
jgi:catechol 2,3-dioxygenase-like lactoylglutathione lyase family enzyme